MPVLAGRDAQSPNSRIRGALIETLFADTDSDTDPSGEQHPQWSYKEREGMALPGAEISQVPVSVALLGFCSLIPSEDSGAWPVMVTGSGAAHGPADMSVVRQLGQGRKSQQVGG